MNTGKILGVKAQINIFRKITMSENLQIMSEIKRGLLL